MKMSAFVGQTNGQVDSNNMYNTAGEILVINGGTTMGNDTSNMDSDYENIFGATGREVKTDAQRHKRHQRWHLPDEVITTFKK